MFKKLRFQNFKSWQDTGDIQLAPLTGFFGTNSSGKSSILHFLLMLKQTVESSDRRRVLNTGDDRDYIELGTFYDISNRHRLPSKIILEIKWILLKTIEILDSELQEKTSFFLDSLTFLSNIQLEKEDVFVNSFQYICLNEPNLLSFGLRRNVQIVRPPRTMDNREDPSTIVLSNYDFFAQKYNLKIIKEK